MKKILQHILIRNIFRKYQNSLPEKSDVLTPKMEYHALADAIFWEDEGLIGCHSDLDNAFRFVIHYRTALVTGENISENTDKRYFNLAKKYFPKWIGFETSRCSYNAQHADRIKRIRKVAGWKIDKLMKESDLEE
jgi:hypothetical protein